jgi:hypothetical protein
VSALDGVDAERVVAVAGLVPDVVAEAVIDVVVAVPTVAVLNSSRSRATVCPKLASGW